jgi:ferric-dicitrate binding protein FerR (iron transport regulator)
MDEDIYGIAIKWFVRLRADNITANEQDDFFEWFFKSKDNHQTFADVLTL